MNRNTRILAVALVAACHPAAPPQIATPPIPCVEPTLPSALTSSTSVTVTAPLTPPHVLDPSNPVSRFAFDRAYETLVRVDCAGRARPALAAEWYAAEGALILRLRDSVRFWNTPTVTATDIIESWRATADVAGNRLVRLVADSSRATDQRTIQIHLAGITPAWLATPVFAITRRTGFGFPDGTGTTVLRDMPIMSQTDAFSRYSLSPVPDGPSEINAVQRRTARDLIDVGRSPLVTGDAEVVSYATSRAGYSSLPLDWDRTWVLLVPTRVGSGGDAEPDSAMWRAFRDGLARDLVGDDARPARVPPWLGAADVCAGAPSARETQLRMLDRVTIGYSNDEPVARAIAERLVALAGAERNTTGITVMNAIAPVLRIQGMTAAAVGLERQEFATALAGERAYAFVLSLPSHSVHPCVEAVPPLGALSWLVEGGTVQTATIIPLIETRWRVLVRGSG